MTTKRVHVLVSGRVQGVFFRASTRAEAVRLGVAGWVKNLEDGRVEFVAEGETGAVDALVLWARRGPDGARVDDARVEVQAYGGELRGFEVLR